MSGMPPSAVVSSARPFAMQHITFARFPDSDSAVAPLQRLQATVASAEVLVHRGARNPADFAQQVEHSPTFETDHRRALVIGAVLGISVGAAFGAVLSLIDIFPGTPLLGATFGAIMGAVSQTDPRCSARPNRRSGGGSAWLNWGGSDQAVLDWAASAC